MTKRGSLSWATLRELAVEATCDPRTIKKVFAGEEVKGGAGERARRALIAHGYLRAPETPKLAEPPAVDDASPHGEDAA